LSAFAKASADKLVAGDWFLGGAKVGFLLAGKKARRDLLGQAH
jgi:hypothetical protein